MKKPRKMVTTTELSTCAARRVWKSNGDAYGEGCLETLPLVGIVQSLFRSSPLSVFSSVRSFEDRRRSLDDDTLLSSPLHFNNLQLERAPLPRLRHDTNQHALSSRANDSS